MKKVTEIYLEEQDEDKMSIVLKDEDGKFYSAQYTVYGLPHEIIIKKLNHEQQTNNP